MRRREVENLVALNGGQLVGRKEDASDTSIALETSACPKWSPDPDASNQRVSTMLRKATFHHPCKRSWKILEFRPPNYVLTISNLWNTPPLPASLDKRMYIDNCPIAGIQGLWYAYRICRWIAGLLRTHSPEGPDQANRHRRRTRAYHPSRDRMSIGLPAASSASV